ncbi:MAG TPA: lysozyme inhibitor LprI family protein [Rhodanobacter sp.]|nr:lysozyme inhibitor LprI family protein [Rhodanobacter sp.]
MSKWRFILCGALVAAAMATMATDKTLPAPQQLAHAAQPWLPGYEPDDWNITHASAASKLACQRSEALPIPQGDPPRAGELPALASCDSQALYYGDNGKPDPIRARQCAYLERGGGNHIGPGGDLAIGGSAVLAMIYANGMGVPRNLPMATKFACEAGGAPAEIDGRIEHLQQMAAATSSKRFDFCDDITSGYMGGVCASIAADQADSRRSDALGEIIRGYSTSQRQAYDALRKAADAYFDAHSGNEVDLSGSARGAFAIEDKETSEQAFIGNLKALEAGKLPSGDAKQADARLNAVYRRVLANPGLKPQDDGYGSMGTITAKGIRADQRLWLAYRDAWLHFAAVRKPALPSDTVLAWLTAQRTDDLRSLLPSKDPDYRSDGN